MYAKPLDLEKNGKNIDCGCIEFWKRWWNARELEKPKIVSELSFSIKALLSSKTESERKLMLDCLYDEISGYFEDAVNFGMLLLLNKLKSACEFYLRYKDNPELLAKEYPEYKEKIEEFSYGHFPIALEYKDTFINADEYNEWLFKLAFKPMFEGVKDEQN